MKTMRTRVLSTSMLMLLGLAGACDKPSVAPTQDTLVCPTDGGDCVLPSTPGTIKGTVVYSGLKRGDVMLLLFDAHNLPPPDGTATSAVSLARIPASTMFGSQAGAGPFSAPYTFTQVVPGSYQIRALIDVNGEFDPFFDYLQQPRAGYPVGGHVSFAQDGTPPLANFDVPANTVVTSINVAIGQELLFDPPSFIYGAGSPNVLSTNIDRPQFLSLSTVNLHVPKASFEKARFAIELKRDANGQPQISDHDGLVDVYPQVILRQLDLLQGNGQSLPVSGEDAAIVPCKVDPLPFLPQLLASKPGDAPIGASNINVLVQPLAVKLHNGVPSPLAAIPPGNYQLIVINKSGQVWTMPNSLGTQQGIASQNI
ncbi:MAG: hypothetical protein JST92_23030, partial [Deltaproteobacteria bacterium]|nr:hypothetical protein [Deltaproteobacteria bacterium]